MLLAADLFLFAASVLFAPWWAVAVLLGAWVVMLAFALGWFTRRPRAIVPLAVAGLAGWCLFVLAGARWWGW